MDENMWVEFSADITRVFFTTSDSDEDLLYLDDEIFNRQTAHGKGLTVNGERLRAKG